MKITDEERIKARELLQSAGRIVVISHRGPDGDTVGSNLALSLALRRQWQKEVVSACVDPVPSNSVFLPEVKNYVRDFDQNWAQLMVTVDVGASYMTKFHETKPDLFSGNPPLINIDHHPTNDRFGAINMVDDAAAAACQIVYHFMKFCGFTITPEIATCLLHGLYYDTGSFMHSNTTPEVLQIAADLLLKGADFRTIARRQFHTMPISQLRLYGRILEHARVNEKGITVSTLTGGDFEEVSASSDDTTGAIDYLNSIQEGAVSCLVYEDRKGSLKGSLRTRSTEVDVSELASRLGGGGHKKASGFSIPGHLAKVDSRIIITP